MSLSKKTFVLTLFISSISGGLALSIFNLNAESHINCSFPTTQLQDDERLVPSDKDEIFVAVEQAAEFPGGQAALMKWISQNLRYPEAARQNDIQGRVVVKIVIEKDGSISDAEIARGADKDLDKEALRLVHSMPKWIPGKNNGVPVRSYFNLPVTFKITDSN